jgi:hypothetical protein
MTQLERLESESIVTFSLIEGNTKIEVMEYCDLYFSVAFNKDDFGKLIEELKELHTSMK